MNANNILQAIGFGNECILHKWTQSSKIIQVKVEKQKQKQNSQINDDSS